MLSAEHLLDATENHLNESLISRASICPNIGKLITPSDPSPFICRSTQKSSTKIWDVETHAHVNAAKASVMVYVAKT